MNISSHSRSLLNTIIRILSLPNGCYITDMEIIADEQKLTSICVLMYTCWEITVHSKTVIMLDVIALTVTCGGKRQMSKITDRSGSEHD